MKPTETKQWVEELAERSLRLDVMTMDVIEQTVRMKLEIRNALRVLFNFRQFLTDDLKATVIDELGWYDQDASDALNGFIAAKKERQQDARVSPDENYKYVIEPGGGKAKIVKLLRNENKKQKTRPKSA